MQDTNNNENNIDTDSATDNTSTIQEPILSSADKINQKWPNSLFKKIRMPSSPKNKRIFVGTSVVLVVLVGSTGWFLWQKHNNNVATHAATTNYYASTCRKTTSVKTNTGVKTVDSDKYLSCIDHSVEAKLTRLYLGAFNRQPDANGLKYWANVMVSEGASMDRIAGLFMTVPEFNKLYPKDITDTNYIKVIYSNVLGRSADADPNALRFWYSALHNRKITRATLLALATESTENVNNIATDVRCFVATSNCSSGLIYVPELDTIRTDGNLSSVVGGTALMTNKKHLIVPYLPRNDGNKFLTDRGWGSPDRPSIVGFNGEYYLSTAIDSPDVSSPPPIKIQLPIPPLNINNHTAYNVIDGKKVAYITQDSSGTNMQLKLADTNGVNKTLIAVSPYNNGAGSTQLGNQAWSPDRSHLAVLASIHNLGTYILIIDTSASTNDFNLAQTTSLKDLPSWIHAVGIADPHLNLGYSVKVAWSSKNQFAVATQQYSYSAMDPRNAFISVLNVDGSNQRTIPIPAKRYASAIQWSPDGTNIAYSSNALTGEQTNINPAYPGTTAITEVLNASTGRVVVPFKALITQSGSGEILDWR